MKKLLAIAAITIISSFAALAQNSADEQEILKIHATLDEAFRKRTSPFSRRVFAKTFYVLYRRQVFERAELLADLRKEMQARNINAFGGSYNLKVRAAGNMGFVTEIGHSSVPAKDTMPSPHKDTGRYTEFMKSATANAGDFRALVGSTARPQIDGAASFEMGLKYAQMLKTQRRCRHRTDFWRKNILHKPKAAKLK